MNSRNTELVRTQRQEKKTVMGDTDLCQKYYLILKDVQLPKTSLPENHCLRMGT